MAADHRRLGSVLVFHSFQDVLADNEVGLDFAGFIVDDHDAYVIQIFTGLG